MVNLLNKVKLNDHLEAEFPQWPVIERYYLLEQDHQIR